jgi:hypothetical protein
MAGDLPELLRNYRQAINNYQEARNSYGVLVVAEQEVRMGAVDEEEAAAAVAAARTAWVEATRVLIRSSNELSVFIHDNDHAAQFDETVLGFIQRLGRGDAAVFKQDKLDTIKTELKNFAAHTDVDGGAGKAKRKKPTKRKKTHKKKRRKRRKKVGKSRHSRRSFTRKK